MAVTPRSIPVFTELQIHRRERRVLKVRPTDPLAALCLSGGGIRSAAFCLGALQALAHRKLLTQFHYLSTVSGGGYIGGWLTRCICETAEQPAPGQTQPPPSLPRQVQDEILGAIAGREPEEVRSLRGFTNFLTPRPGLSSDDTWAGLALWMRNTLINWMVFFPLLLTVAAIPVGYFALLGALRAGGAQAVSFTLAAAIVGLPCLANAVYHSCVDLPSHVMRDTSARQRDTPALQLDGTAVRHRIVRWVLCWAAAVPLAMAPLLQPGETYDCARGAFMSGPASCHDLVLHGVPAAELTSGFVGTFPMLAMLPLFAWIACLAAFGFAFRTIRRSYVIIDAAQADNDPRLAAQRAEQLSNRKLQLLPFRTNLLAWMLSSLVSCGLLWLGAWLACMQSVAVLAILGPVWVIGSEILRSSLYVAFRQNGLRSDIDREWLGRLSASKLRSALSYGAVAAAAIVLPGLVLDTGTFRGWVIAAAGFAPGPAAAALGKSVLTRVAPGGGDAKPWLPLDTLVGAAVAIFAATMVMLAGRLVVVIVLPLVPDQGFTAGVALWRAAIAAFALGGLCYAVAHGIGSAINLNLFSMHAVYRNRLVRAFLGSARKQQRGPDLREDVRMADAFTGFDPRDDVRVAEAFTRREPPCLFPVINVALNRTVDSDTARAERKADSFTITPTHCGSPGLARARNGRPGTVPAGAYVATEHYAGESLEFGPEDNKRGIRLGSAITISGAAASPDMGYLSSPYTAFVMTLFNVRLGAWLPNPAACRPTRALMRSTGPRDAIHTLLAELSGRASAAGDYVYLSDGGHFDNLGLYEMLRRRCAFIVAIDAGQDPDYGYFDIGRTLQHALIDLGVTVDFLQPLTVGKKELQPHAAYAKVKYPAKDDLPAIDGELLYLKPWLPADAPTPLQAFKATHPSFPHETTLNQFFTESDFESYRALGSCITDTALGLATAKLPAAQQCQMQSIFTELRHCAAPPKPMEAAK